VDVKVTIDAGFTRMACGVDPEEGALNLCTIELYGVSQSILKYAPRLEWLLHLSGRTGNAEGARRHRGFRGGEKEASRVKGAISM
jgi:hypothetical protein